MLFKVFTLTVIFYYNNSISTEQYYYPSMKE